MRDFRRVLAFCVVGVLAAALSADASSPAGEYLKFVRQMPAGEDPVDAVIASDGDVLVLDRHKCEVIVFSPEGERLSHFASSGVDDGQFKSPRSLSIGRDGAIIVTDTGNRRLQVFGPDGEFRYQLGSAGDAPGKFKEPFAAAAGPLGNILVVDRAKKTVAEFTADGVFLREDELPGAPQDVVVDVANRVYILLPEQKAVVTFDADDPERRFEVMQGREDVQDELSAAKSLAVDAYGDVYLLDGQKHRVVKWRPDGETPLSFGARGEGMGQFDIPMGINVGTDGRIVVADSRNHRVQEFQITGSEQEELTPVKLATQPRVILETAVPVGAGIVDLETAGENIYALTEEFGMIWRVGEDTEMLAVAQEREVAFERPQAIGVRGNGSMVVTDTGHHQLTFLNADGTHQYQFGDKGKDNGQFSGPAGVAMNAGGDIYVADSGNHRIEVFNPEGVFLRSFGKRSENPEWPGVGTFDQPTDLAFDSLGQLYVLDSKNKRVQVFDANDKLVKVVGGEYGPVRFDDPVDIAIDERDYLYVADRGSHAIKIIDPEGRPVLQFGSAARGGGGYFPSLSAVTVSGDRIYVADAASDELQIFRFLSDPEKEKNPEEEYFYFTRVADSLNMENASEDVQHAMARKLTLEQTKKELTAKLNITAEQFQSTVQIVDEIVLDNGQLQLTMRLPRALIPEMDDVSESP